MPFWISIFVFGTLPLKCADLLQSVSQSAVMGRNFHQNMKMMEKGDEWCGLRRAPSVLRETTMVSKAPWELIASGIKFIFPTFLLKVHRVCICWTNIFHSTESKSSSLILKNGFQFQRPQRKQFFAHGSWRPVNSRKKKNQKFRFTQSLKNCKTIPKGPFSHFS